MFKLFATLFAGPSGVITEWFASMFGKIIGVLAIVAVIAGMGTSVYFSWSNDIKEAAQARIAAEQAAELAKDKEAEIAQIKAIQVAKDKADADLRAATAQTSANSDAIKLWIAQQPATADRPVSNVIQETFDRLYGKDK